MLGEMRGCDVDKCVMNNSWNGCVGGILSALIFKTKQWVNVTEGYGVDRNRSGMWMREIPEYSYKLGAPRGRVVKKGYVYQRKFQYATITVDIKIKPVKLIGKRNKLRTRAVFIGSLCI